MGYNVIDILDKGINVSSKRKAIFDNIANEKCGIPSIKIMSKILANEVDKSINYYKKLKDEIGETELEEIDIMTYDKMSFLINEFSKRILVPEIHDVREFLIFSIQLEKDVYSLLVDVQGRFVKGTSDVHTKTYKILGDLISNTESHIKSLEKTLH